MKNPLESIKAAWKNPKKRPLFLAGGGAAAAAAYFTLRPEPAEEEAAAESPTSPPPDGAHGAYGAEVAGGGMHGVYVTSPPMDYESPPMDHDPGWEEMDFSPIFDAIAEQGDAFDTALQDSIAVEREEREQALNPLKRSVSRLQRQNKRQSQRIQRQRQNLRKQRRQLARTKRRSRQAPARRRGRARQAPNRQRARRRQGQKRGKR